MIRRWFTTVALSALILAGVVAPCVVAAQSQPPAQPPAAAQPPSQAPAQAAQPQMRTATGKITAVSGQMFSIEVGQGDTKQTLQFVTDSTTTKSGDLKVGSTATVQYRPGDGGKNTASKVDVQS